MKWGDVHRHLGLSVEGNHESLDPQREIAHRSVQGYSSAIRMPMVPYGTESLTDTHSNGPTHKGGPITDTHRPMGYSGLMYGVENERPAKKD